MDNDVDVSVVLKHTGIAVISCTRCQKVPQTHVIGSGAAQAPTSIPATFPAPTAVVDFFVTPVLPVAAPTPVVDQVAPVPAVVNAPKAGVEYVTPDFGVYGVPAPILQHCPRRTM